jgi:prepilin-type N-terminal cleavage/methylation domain-containing protein
VKPGRARGFTLLEVVIALTILATLLVVAYGGLRVGLSAWRQGEDRAEAHQHVRALTTLLARSIAGAYQYHAAPIPPATESTPHFEGGPERLAFVTLVPPFALAAPIAFTAVVIRLDTGDAPGLSVRERALPAREPFADSSPVFRDPTVAKLSFRYMRAGGGWEESWDANAEGGLPAAIQITLTPTESASAGAPPPITVALRVSVPP